MSHVDEANQCLNGLLSASKEALAMLSPEKRAQLKNALDDSEHLVPKREVHIRHWAVVLDIVQYALEGNQEKAREYAVFLLQLLEKDEQDMIASYLKRVLAGDKGQMVYYITEKGK